MTQLDRRFKYDRDTRVLAVALYLIGLPTKEITQRCGIKDGDGNGSIITHWVKQAGCFKLRKPRKAA